MDSNFDINNAIYQQELLQHIKSLTESESRLSFHEIVSNSEGASPISVKYILDSFSIEYTNKDSIPSSSNNNNILSDPHPADFDWRFNEATIKKYLYDLINFSEKKIALLGTKTIFTGLVDKKIDTIIFNRSASLLNDFRLNGYLDGLVECDLFNKQPSFNNHFDLVIADPPWYLEYYEAFINRGSEFLNTGGILHLSVLKKLTRPFAANDRQEIIIYAQNAGFELVEIIPNYFTYETPNFERNTLKVQGLYCENWRKSDLFIFKKINFIKNEIVIDNKNDDESWIEFKWKNKKIKIKQDNIQEDSFFYFESADPSNIVFTNVSRRSPYRERIDVWTSDNLAFRVYKLKILVSYFELLISGKEYNHIILVLKSQFLLSEQEAINLTNLIKIIFE
jgi:hypothetical protein